MVNQRRRVGAPLEGKIQTMRTLLLIPLTACLILPFSTILGQGVDPVTGVVSNWVSHDVLPTPEPEPYVGPSPLDTAGSSFEVIDKHPPCEIRPIPGGAIADFGRSTVAWTTDASARPAVTMISREGTRLSFRATFLVLADRSTGENYLLAQVTNCTGQIVSSSAVLYPDALDGISADLKYEYDWQRDALEQFVILHESPPVPEGADPKHLRLECWTEWIEGEPISQRHSKIVTREAAVDISAVEEDSVELSFGTMKVIGRGKAFSLGTDAENIPVAKTFGVVDAGQSQAESGAAPRRFLIEAVDYLAASPFLTKLGKAKSQASLGSGTSRADLVASSSIYMDVFPRVANTDTLVARTASEPTSGFVIDFCLQGSVTPPYGLISW